VKYVENTKKFKIITQKYLALVKNVNYGKHVVYAIKFHISKKIISFIAYITGIMNFMFKIIIQ
jgi:hypothetical protein